MENVILLKWIEQYLVDELAKHLTPEEVDKLVAILLEEIKKELTKENIGKLLTPVITVARQWAKDKTPDFPYDDAVVEIVAKAFGVP